MAMDEKKKEALKSLGMILLGGTASAIMQGGGYTGRDFGVGFAARPNGRIWVKEGARNDGGMDGTSIGAMQQLAKEKVSEPLDFNAGVVYVPGAAQNNRMLQRTPENLASFIRQSKQEHNQALEQFFDNPDIPKDRAARLGMKQEKLLPKWWNDKDPRRPVTPSSSCVKRARIGANGDIYVVFGSNPNKEYQYEGNADPVKASKALYDLVTAPSIGRAVNSWKGDWGKRHTYLPKG
ncbi:MAG: hypothetical protein II304_00690 [Bacteroidales bacterium]|nr:hypothetical protein [Bacteroidales bacterium]